VQNSGEADARLSRLSALAHGICLVFEDEIFMGKDLSEWRWVTKNFGCVSFFSGLLNLLSQLRIDTVPILNHSRQTSQQHSF
jgi:hypothetical protein